MYWEKFIDKGRPAERQKNLYDLLRLTLASIDIASARRQVLDSTEYVGAVPDYLENYSHSTYETAVVSEFYQLARHDFVHHKNSAVWERPISWRPDGGSNFRNGHIDLSLFSEARGVETRIEFGKSDPRVRTKRDLKLESDAVKLLEAHDYFLPTRPSNQADSASKSTMAIENFVVVWDEKDTSRKEKAAKLSPYQGKVWLEKCKEHAKSASHNTGGNVSLEGVSASTLLTIKRDHLRTAYAAIYSISPAD